jgi:hypothetical protein
MIMFEISSFLLAIESGQSNYGSNVAKNSSASLEIA